MGIFKKTTNFFRGDPSIAERLRRQFVACAAGTGNRNIEIRIFDSHGLIADMAPPNEVVADLQAFLSGMHTSPGIEPGVAASLASFNFHVTYRASDPTKNEVDGFGRNDFPIYLRTTVGTFASSKDEILSLLVAHRIPENTFVGRRVGANLNPIFAPAIHPYTEIETDWIEERSTLGFGIPGPYFIPNNQNQCRKLGIIKMGDFMLVNLALPQRKAKLISVLKHELGHMFAHVHQPNTLMDEKYDVNFLRPTFENDQLWVISRSLEVLTQP